VVVAPKLHAVAVCKVFAGTRARIRVEVLAIGMPGALTRA